MIPTTTDSTFSQRAFLFMMALATSSSSVQEVRAYSVAIPISQPSSFDKILAYPRTKEVPTAIDTSTHRKEDDSVAFFNKQERSTASRSTYDLGIGKNKPVLSKRDNDGTFNAAVSQPQSVFEATRYWSDHEAVREYPSPTQSTEDMFANDIKPKKALPMVNPTRQAHDVLTILVGTNSSPLDDPSTTTAEQRQQKKHPIMVPSTEQRGPQLDVNTVWVEMLIHSEQLKQQQRLVLATAAAAAN